MSGIRVDLRYVDGRITKWPLPVDAGHCVPVTQPVLARVAV